MAIAVSILTPSPLVSQRLQRRLADEPDVHLLVVPAEPDLAIGKLRRADVALLHHELPQTLLLRQLRGFRLLPDSARPVIVDVPDEPELLVRYIEYGAVGYVLRDEPDARLIKVVRGAAQGDVRLGPRLTLRLIERYRQLCRQREQVTTSADRQIGWNDRGQHHRSADG